MRKFHENYLILSYVHYLFIKLKDEIVSSLVDR